MNLLSNVLILTIAPNFLSVEYGNTTGADYFQFNDN